MMDQTLRLLTVVTLMLTASPAPIRAEAAPAQPTTEAAHPGLPLPADQGKLFSGSGACAPCHTGMSDETGADVSIDSAWRSTMMANAARDPYWRATVGTEVLANPTYQAVIEDKCATCHTPMARSSIAADGGKGKVLGEGGVLDSKHPLQPLATDGVSCTLCHQIRESGFGQPESFSGGFVIDTSLPAGQRPTFGPFPVDENLAGVMQGVSGFIPVHSEHVKRSELCATCHTLYTPSVDSKGQIAGQFPEQMAYFEYLNSDHRRTRACQDCHMPAAAGKVPIGSPGGEPRSPFVQHTFVGGNAYMGQVLKTFGEELAVTASGEHFDRTLERVSDQLRTRTAEVAIEAAKVSGSRLMATVVVRTHVGHKFPTGFPSRRAWLHFSVSDASGRVLFESGAVKAEGSIVGNDNDADPAAYEPHHLQIDRADQVQIYEAIIGDSDGHVTTTLLRGADYLKDNRLLPSGFVKRQAKKDIAVHGQALQDRDFEGGGDKIRYAVELRDARGPLTVSVELLYQSIAHRWAQNLRRYDTPDVSRFLSYYEKVPNRPIVVATATAQVRK